LSAIACSRLTKSEVGDEVNVLSLSFVRLLHDCSYSAHNNMGDDPRQVRYSTNCSKCARGAVDVDKDGDIMAGFAKGLQVIEAFDEDHDALSIADVGRLTGLDRATARRCLLTLVRGGYASLDGRLFELTPMSCAWVTPTWPPHPFPAKCSRSSSAFLS
jgi:hypothetical protein